MSTYEFTLRFRYTDQSVGVDERLERLFEAGCDDAVPGVGRSDSVALAFDRSAGSAREAVLSAIADVTHAMPDAQLLGASPDLVGLTDAAESMGFSRQNMRKLLMTAGGAAPACVHDGAPALWHLADILLWLDGKGYQVDRDLLEVAGITMQVNLAVQAARWDGALQREIARAVG
jgi:hypothetical protein